MRRCLNHRFIYVSRNLRRALSSKFGPIGWGGIADARAQAIRRGRAVDERARRKWDTSCSFGLVSPRKRPPLHRPTSSRNFNDRLLSSFVTPPFFYLPGVRLTSWKRSGEFRRAEGRPSIRQIRRRSRRPCDSFLASFFQPSLGPLRPFLSFASLRLRSLYCSRELCGDHSVTLQLKHRGLLEKLFRSYGDVGCGRNVYKVRSQNQVFSWTIGTYI